MPRPPLPPPSLLVVGISNQQSEGDGPQSETLDQQAYSLKEIGLLWAMRYTPVVKELNIPHREFSLKDLFRSLTSHPRETWLRIAIPAVRLVMPIWEQACPKDKRPQQMLEAAEKLVLRNNRQSRSESGRHQTASKAAFIKTDAQGTPAYVAKAAFLVGKAANGSNEQEATFSCFKAVKIATGCMSAPQAKNSDASFAAENPSSEIMDQVLEAIRGEVVPWVLKSHDAILARHPE